MDFLQPLVYFHCVHHVVDASHPMIFGTDAEDDDASDCEFNDAPSSSSHEPTSTITFSCAEDDDDDASDCDWNDSSEPATSPVLTRSILPSVIPRSSKPHKTKPGKDRVRRVAKVCIPSWSRHSSASLVCAQVLKLNSAARLQRVLVPDETKGETPVCGCGCLVQFKDKWTTVEAAWRANAAMSEAEILNKILTYLRDNGPNDYRFDGVKVCRKFVCFSLDHAIATVMCSSSNCV